MATTNFLPPFSGCDNPIDQSVSRGIGGGTQTSPFANANKKGLIQLNLESRINNRLAINAVESCGARPFIYGNFQTKKLIDEPLEYKIAFYYSYDFYIELDGGAKSVPIKKKWYMIGTVVSRAIVQSVGEVYEGLIPGQGVLVNDVFKNLYSKQHPGYGFGNITDNPKSPQETLDFSMKLKINYKYHWKFQIPAVVLVGATGFGVKNAHALCDAQNLSYRFILHKVEITPDVILL